MLVEQGDTDDLNKVVTPDWIADIQEQTDKDLEEYTNDQMEKTAFNDLKDIL
jgi:hypothetical protein